MQDKIDFSRKNVADRLRYIANVFFGGRTGKLAEHFNMSPQAFSKYLGGDRTLGGEKLSLLTKLGVSVEWVLTGEGEPFNPDTLSTDAQWKRLFIIRRRTTVFRGTKRIASEMLGVDKEKYDKWEMGLETIPQEVVDRIYAMVQTFVRKKWWYKGKGDMMYETITTPGIPFDYSEAFGLPEKEGSTSPPLPIDDTQERIMECITEMVKRPKEYDRAVFGELLKMKLREIGVLPDEPDKQNR